MEPITGLEPVTPDYKSGALPAKLYRRGGIYIIYMFFEKVK